jgi:hypothetical protein
MRRERIDRLSVGLVGRTLWADGQRTVEVVELGITLKTGVACAEFGFVLHNHSDIDESGRPSYHGSVMRQEFSIVEFRCFRLDKATFTR